MINCNMINILSFFIIWHFQNMIKKKPMHRRHNAKIYDAFVCQVQKSTCSLFALQVNRGQLWKKPSALLAKYKSPTGGTGGKAPKTKSNSQKITGGKLKKHLPSLPTAKKKHNCSSQLPPPQKIKYIYIKKIH